MKTVQGHETLFLGWNFDYLKVGGIYGPKGIKLNNTDIK